MYTYMHHIFLNPEMINELIFLDTIQTPPYNYTVFHFFLHYYFILYFPFFFSFPWNSFATPWPPYLQHGGAFAAVRQINPVVRDLEWLKEIQQEVVVQNGRWWVSDGGWTDIRQHEGEEDVVGGVRSRS